MALEVQGKVGIQVTTDGNLADPRIGRRGDVVVSDGAPRLYEATSRGQAFTASTAVAGVTAAGATTLAATCAFALFNPQGSGVNVALLRTFVGYISGTLGVGNYVYAIYPQAATALGGTAVAASALLNNGIVGSASGAKATAATGNCLAGAPSILRPTGISHGAYAGAATQGNTPWVDNVDGGIVLMPGTALALFDLGTAGTTDKLIFGMDWLELAP